MTRLNFLADLRARQGRNRAIIAHADKIERMTDAQFEVHYAKLQTMAASTAVVEAAFRMAKAL
jgi:hypothetical protein